MFWSFLDKPGTGNRLLAGVGALMAVLLVAEQFVEAHPHFSWESWPGFYGAFGFLAYSGIVLGARHLLRPAVRRPADIYSRHDKGGERSGSCHS